MTERPRAEANEGRERGEWVWRFLAASLFVAVGWVGWIAYQVNPSPLATPAAYNAATQALATRNVQSGTIKPAPKDPPVNVEKLRLADTLAAPAEAPDGKK